MEGCGVKRKIGRAKLAKCERQQGEIENREGPKFDF